jgi:hypothetical protein
MRDKQYIMRNKMDAYTKEFFAKQLKMKCRILGVDLKDKKAVVEVMNEYKVEWAKMFLALGN